MGASAENLRFREVRQAVLGKAVVWRTADGTADGTVSEAAGPRVRSPPCAPPDASHAAGSDLSGAQHEQETPTA